MAEPRMRLRHKGQQFSETELIGLLRAFGDSESPLPATITVLDEILTDFIIETCHSAALCASYSRRQKIKLDDFKWVLRRDSRKLGTVVEKAFREKMVKEARQAFHLGTDETAIVKTAAVKRKGGAGGEEGIEGVGGDGEGLEGGGGEKGRKKKRKKNKVEKE